MGQEQAQSSFMFVPKFKAKAPPGAGIWTPNNQTPATSLNNLNDNQSSPTPPPPPPPTQRIWTPQPSPDSGRKEFRPVHFESPTLARRYVVQHRTGSGAVQPPWSSNCTNGQSHFALSSPRSVHSLTNLSTPTTVGSNSTNYCDSYPSESSINNGAISSVADKIKTIERSASTSQLYSPLSRRQHNRCLPFYRPNEVIYKVKHEYMSEPETENDRPRKMAQLSRRQFDGIGPVTNDGMPIVLRSEVKEPHQHEWYKQLYQTIHKQKCGDDYVIRYKCQRARPQFKSTGYQSEPEHHIDSDYSTVKYRTLDRQRLQSVSSAANVRSGANSHLNDKLYGTMPSPIKSGQSAYRNQPGRIENYVTGNSSVSEKERKEWWDEVMDIFNGWLKDNRIIPRILIEFATDETHLDQTKLSPHYAEGNLSRALAKESGYSSDSNLVFRKKEIPQSSPLSPIEQRQAYKNVQAGGEPPLFGFRKPAPERQKGLVQRFEYTQITPSHAILRGFCNASSAANSTTYTSANTTKNVLSVQKLDMHTPFSKDMPSFITLSQGEKAPPQPPNRKSSCRKTLVTDGSKLNIPKRHEQCFQSPKSSVATINKYGTITLRKNNQTPISRSKSKGTVSAPLAGSKIAVEPRLAANSDRGAEVTHMQQRTRYRSISPARSQNRVMALRQTSRSPVAFGRSISKERTFAEEKKRLENTLPLHYTNFEASTNILRDPLLRSPQEVKQAVRSYATCASHLRSNSLPRLRTAHTVPTSSVSTTIRHSMCFPQTKLFDCAKTFRKIAGHSRSPIPKATSSVSLVRTDSTFSVESLPTKCKPTKSTKKKAPETKTFLNNLSKPVRAKKEVTTPCSTGDAFVMSDRRSYSNAKKQMKLIANAKASACPSKSTTAKDNCRPCSYIHESFQAFPHSHKPNIHKSRSLSPRRHYQTNEDIDITYFDTIVSQSEQTDLVDRNAGYLKTSKSNKKFQKFSPTREIRVSQTQDCVQIPQSVTSKSLTSVMDIARPLSPTSSEKCGRKFSPTREIRVPQNKIPGSTVRTPSPPTTYKSLNLAEDIARPLSASTSGKSSRKFSPTREIRVSPASHRSARSHSPAKVIDPFRSEPLNTDGKIKRFSPTREVRVPQTSRNVRSPSRRRIDTYRAQSKTDASKIIRASSLSSADDRSKRGLYLCGELAHSATSLTYLERHSPTCRYRNNSERFTDLNQFYSTLERIGQLERATSLTSFKPIRKHSELVDFDEWRKTRCHERVEKELNYLVDKLKQDQRTKDLIFRSKDPDDVRWRQETDFGLHSKNKSVENLRYAFERKHFLLEHEQANDVEDDGSQDYIKPFWRRNTVADLASSLENKLSHVNSPLPAENEQTQFHLSNRLVSTLSKDQIKKITKQLNEIYSNTPKLSTDEYVVTVNHESSSHITPGTSTLKVRCNSSITKEDLMEPKMTKKNIFAKAMLKAHGKSEKNPDSGGIQHKLSEPKECTSRGTSPVVLARETRGAVAAKNAEATLIKTPHIPLQSDYSPTQIQNDSLPTQFETLSHAHYADFSNVVESNATNENQSPQTENKEAVDNGREPKEKIAQKIQFFEERQFEETPTTIYHAREDSSPDEDEVMRIIEENMKSRDKRNIHKRKELSSSLTNLEDMFGEKHSARVNFHLDFLPQRPPDPPEETPVSSKQHDFMKVSSTWYNLGDFSPHSSIERFDSYYRTRSLSPESQASCYLHRVHTGDVRKMKEKFESFDTQLQQETNNKRLNFFGLNSLRKVRSDPVLQGFDEGSKDTFQTLMDNEEHRDVSCIAHKFELHNRSLCDSQCWRSWKKMSISPTPQRDRLMPHIDIISKTAALKEEVRRKQLPKNGTGRISDVKRICNQYERSQLTSSLSTSNPDITNANVFTQHLTANWVAHKYPSPKQNMYTDNARQEKNKSSVESKSRSARTRSNSESPPRPPKSRKHKDISLKSQYDDIFANQDFDPKIHQPKARYVPDGAEISCWKKASPPRSWYSGSNDHLKGSITTSFQDCGNVSPLPTPPTRMGRARTPELNGNYSESPNRYLESDVNIHFKTPIRHEYKNPMSEEELATRQAEQMQKLYQEERRRKYLQELQDMRSRRHTDNFTPSQKSPIPLNRYDDFQSDLAPKSPIAATKAVARALHNFQGQNARELSFKKGDVIYIRRQIDRNWYEGEYNAMIGLLPVNYVEIVNKDSARPQPRTKPSEGQARAKYSFQAQSGVELSLNKGELVTLTRRVDENWFEGKIANRKGIFPVSYVEVLTDIGAEDIASKTVITEHSTTNLRPSLDTLRTNINQEFNLITKNGHQPPNGILKETKNLNKIDALHVDTSSDPLTYRALYRYRPQKADEMELLEGDIIHVLEMCSDGWFVGTSQRTGCFGTFPGNYVERV